SERFVPAAPSDVRRIRDGLGIGTAPLLLTVGSITPRKGQDVVVRALGSLDRRPLVHYAVAGRENDRGGLRDLVAQLGLQSRVHLRGTVPADDLAALYTACDIYVTTSRRTADGDVEGFGIAVVEAALCGRPAIVSSGSGLTDAVRPDVTALVVPPE